MQFVTRQIRRILCLSLIVFLVGGFVLYDRNRVVADSMNAKRALFQARNASIFDRKERVVKFVDKTLSVYESGKLVYTDMLKTLDSVNYDTILGDGMIVFTAGGTGPYNKMIHGGDITFRSWLGFTKSLWVNCTGYIVEGVMPSE